MATPRTGRKRGRPPKPKDEPARGRGRPSEPLSQHRFRFQIAAFDAAQICSRLSARTASKGLVAAAFGEPAPFDLDPPDPNHPELAAQHVPLSVEQFDQHSDLLRKLAARFPKTDADRAWLRNVSQAIMIGITFGQHEKETAMIAALSKAKVAGEERWAREVLLPWIQSMPEVPETLEDLDTITRILVDLLSHPN
jgi:hypothetical protein